jgi:hypothetical protein
MINLSRWSPTEIRYLACSVFSQSTRTSARSYGSDKMTETRVALSNWLAEICVHLEWHLLWAKCESKWIVVSWIKWEPCNFDQLGAFLSFDNDASHNWLPSALWLQSPPLTILSPPTLPQAAHYLGPLMTSIKALDQKSTSSEFKPTLGRIRDAQTRSEVFSSKSSFETWLPRSNSESWSVLRNSLKLPKDF